MRPRRKPRDVGASTALAIIGTARRSSDNWRASRRPFARSGTNRIRVIASATIAALTTTAPNANLEFGLDQPTMSPVIRRITAQTPRKMNPATSPRGPCPRTFER